MTSKVYSIIRITIQILSSIFSVILLFFSKMILDKLTSDYHSSGHNLQEYILPLILFLLCLIITKSLVLLNSYFQDLHIEMIRKHLDLKIINKIRTLDISFFDSPSFYDDLQNLGNDITAIEQTSRIAMELIKSAIQLVTSSIMLFMFNAWIIGIIIVLSIPYFLIVKHYTLFKYSWHRKQASNFRKRSYISFIFKSRETSKESRIFNYSEILIDKYKSLWNEWFYSKKSILRKEATSVSLASLLPETGKMAIWFYIISRIVVKELTVGDFSLYTGLVSQLNAGVNGIIMIISNLSKETNKLKNYSSFLEKESNIVDTGERQLGQVTSVEFRNVCFKYPSSNRYALDNVSFEINQSEKIAIVGPNGAGKTTIINLLLRLYEPSSGEIFINGLSIKKYSLTSLRKQFSVLLQDFPHYAFTLKESISLVDSERNASRDEIIDHCNSIGLKDFVNHLPNGIDTHITRRFDQNNGVELSIGEKQRVALARALFRKCSFIIFDEPSSSLDAKAEDEIFMEIYKYSEEKITLYVSHRLSNVVNADKILVIEQGKLVEKGCHNDLLGNKSTYYQLFTVQASKYTI